jgi:hypothetical protein
MDRPEWPSAERGVDLVPARAQGCMARRPDFRTVLVDRRGRTFEILLLERVAPGISRREARRI